MEGVFKKGGYLNTPIRVKEKSTAADVDTPRNPSGKMKGFTYLACCRRSQDKIRSVAGRADRESHGISKKECLKRLTKKIKNPTDLQVEERWN